MESWTRRKFLKSAAGAALVLPFSPLFMRCTSLRTDGPHSFNSATGIDGSPIERVASGSAQAAFSGDSPEAAHHWFWNHEKLLEQILAAPVTAEVPVVIAGGGMSGLLTAYALREYDPLLLEQATRFGGNSRGEVFESSTYSIGAAYLSEPEPGTNTHRLFKDLNLNGKYRRIVEADPVVWQGKAIASLEDRASVRDRKILRQLSGYFADTYAERNGAVFPNLPEIESGRREKVEALDRNSLQAHLEKVIGHSLPVSYSAYLRRYCQSAFCGLPGEISAAAGMNFLAGEEGKIIAFPGGNSYIAEAIYRALPAKALRSQCQVLAIRSDGAGVRVTFVGPDGKCQAVRAKAAVCAMPKFVAKHVVADVSAMQRAAWEGIRYRAYMVANLTLSRRPGREFFDMYLLDASSHSKATPWQVTDVINASDVSSGNSSFALTVYIPVPVDGARGMILNNPERIKSELTQSIVAEVLPHLSLRGSDVSHIRFTRWGHAIPLAAPGSYAAGIPELISATVNDRIFFAQQDNWVLPAFETAVAESERVVPRIKEILT